jgi:hypothetical protein
MVRGKKTYGTFGQNWFGVQVAKYIEGKYNHGMPDYQTALQ